MNVLSDSLASTTEDVVNVALVKYVLQFYLCYTVFGIRGYIPSPWDCSVFVGMCLAHGVARDSSWVCV